MGKVGCGRIVAASEESDVAFVVPLAGLVGTGAAAPVGRLEFAEVGAGLRIRGKESVES